jgi:hypothetical protein
VPSKRSAKKRRLRPFGGEVLGPTRVLDCSSASTGIDPEDLRRHRLIVTSAGRRIMMRGLTLLSGAFGARLERLNGAEQAELCALLAVAFRAGAPAPGRSHSVPD